MRTFRREFPEYATGLFTEHEGEDVSGITPEVGLSTSKDTPPAEWLSADVVLHPTPSTIRVKLLIDESVQAAPKYFLWVRVPDNPETLVRVGSNAWFAVI